MANRFDVVAIRVADEGKVVVVVVLGPDPWFMQHFGAPGDGGGEKDRTVSRSAAAKAMCDSRNPSPVDRGPIQKSGFGGTP